MTNIANALPCPFCGSTALRIVEWSDDRGEFDAIECDECTAAAPVETWNTRAPTYSAADYATKDDYTPPHWEMAE